MPTPTPHAVRMAALAAAVAGVSSAVTVAVQRGSSPPGIGGAAPYTQCVIAEEVYYVQTGDTVDWVPQLGTALRDSLIKADSTTDTATPYAAAIQVCTRPGQAMHAVIKD